MRSWMIATGCLLCFDVMANATVAAEKFPYQAVVESKTAYVRSGPGEQYYPTTRLRAGDSVEVHRHDPGGWYMIAPPAGSFSWVPARYVDIVGQGEGEILEENVVVFVGSEFGDDHTVFQRRLSPGETVRVTGERDLQTRRGREKMYRIAPPQREWRWIQGRSVNTKSATTDTVAQRQTNSDPREFFIDRDSKKRDWKNRNEKPPREPQTPAELKRAEDAADPSLKVASRDGKILNGRKLLEYLTVDRQKLATLDQKFKKIVLGDKGQWDFTALDQDYQQLAKATNSPQLRRQIESRFAALARYRRAKKHYDEFVALTQPTSGDPRTAATSGIPLEDPLVPGEQLVNTNVADSGPQLPATTTPVRRKKLVGAGIVQRSVAPGMPRFVLVSPEGKILSYLQASSKVDLAKHVGQPRGIQGERFFRPEISADQIIVDDLQPVRLKKAVASRPSTASP